MATILKIVIVGLINAFGVVIALSAVAGDSLIMAIVIVLIIIFLDFVYFTKFVAPLKFLGPGMIFLAVFVLFPMVFTIVMSGFRYSTANQFSKEDAIVSIIDKGQAEDYENPMSFDMRLGHPASDPKKISALLTLQGECGTAYYGIQNEVVTPLEPGTYTTQDPTEEDLFYDPTLCPIAVGTDGFTPLTDDELGNLDATISTLTFKLPEGETIGTSGFDLAVKLTNDLVYDAKTDTITSISTGIVYVDGGQGNFINPDDPEDFGPFSAMQTGWRSVNFPDNFTNLFTEERLRTPFIGVFIWTIVFAFMAVFTSFFLGLLLAIAMDKKFKGRNFYRSILILPYAIPSLMSILIWRGMFNRDFGYINLLLKTIGIGDPDSPINWLDQPWTARAVIIVVNLWLGFPYMYLISTGALQSIPAELKEAASIDGASTWQTFKLITLPLLLQVLSPLLIASFAFNFNNFNIVYLLTGGGPTDETSGQIAGATDILISYAYKTAISNPQNQDFGTASAISMFMFVIVGVLSMWSLRRSKVLEGM